MSRTVARRLFNVSVLLLAIVILTDYLVTPLGSLKMTMLGLWAVLLGMANWDHPNIHLAVEPEPEPPPQHYLGWLRPGRVRTRGEGRWSAICLVSVGSVFIVASIPPL
jgi:hypothetical protein